MEEKNEVNNNNSNSNSNSNSNNNKVDEVILPGFRFHPTDEELVGFYLRRKILQQSLPIELIKQVDIYKYDPWDLPKLASTGEKEWYFYCPRDRKYRNSARPNRVTCAGFWKATGTDRPIYSSEAAKCIGLKKSLVFYRGRAAKGIKTDWMMHEFRLPSLSDSSGPPKKLFDKTLPANDSWAICRIFKKTNSMAQRALSHSWISPLPEIHPISDMFSNVPNHTAAHHISPENISCTTDHLHGTPSTESFNHVISRADLPTNLMFPTADMIAVPRSTPEVSSMLLNLSPAFTNDAAKPTDVLGFGVSQHQFNGFPVADDQFYFRKIQNQIWNNSTRSIGFPTTLSSWDSSVPCPSELSTSISSNKCYL